MGAVNDAWKEFLSGVPWVCAELDEVIDRVPTLMADYGLASYDAAHVATAIDTSVRRIVTLDADFAVIPVSELDVHVDSSRVAHCRLRRARR